jgi:hypothetical protein
MKQPSTEPTTIDGPYVLYSNDSVFVNYIEDNSGVKSVKNRCQTNFDEKRHYVAGKYRHAGQNI